jgi:hypothetical protein
MDYLTTIDCQRVQALILSNNKWHCLQQSPAECDAWLAADDKKKTRQMEYDRLLEDRNEYHLLYLLGRKLMEEAIGGSHGDSVQRLPGAKSKQD